MLDSSNLRKGLKLEIDGEPYIVVQFEFVKPGKKEQPWQVDGITGATISSTAIGTRSASWAMPGFPGAQYNSFKRGLCRSFQHRACSRPPLPMTSTFMNSCRVYQPGSLGRPRRRPPGARPPTFPCYPVR